MVKKIETIDAGVGNIQQSEEEALGMGSARYEDFECTKKKDPNFEYRWVRIENVARAKATKYLPITEEEFNRIKPFYGQFSEGACHLFKDSNKHKILMRCPKKMFTRRRELYGSQGRDAVIKDKEHLKEQGNQAWKRGDSIKPGQIIDDSRVT